jgi:hypothetical protein
LSPDEIIAEATRAGLRLAIKAGQVTVQGAGTRPIHLLEAIRSNKSQIVLRLRAEPRLLSEGSEQRDESPKAEGDIPPTDLPLPDVLPVLSSEKQRVLIDMTLTQGKQAVGWCLLRANAYWLKFPSSSWIEQDAGAANDLLRWEANTRSARHLDGSAPEVAGSKKECVVATEPEPNRRLAQPP